MYLLSYFQCISCNRLSDWDLVEEKSGVSIGILDHPTGHSLEGDCVVRGLRPGEFHKVDSDQEQALPANTFIRRFITARDEFPAHEFRAPGWIYFPDGTWWTCLMDFISDELQVPLTLSGLEIPVVATRTGIVQSSFNFFTILGNYNPDTCTFFTPIGELGFALHEMLAVSGLPFGEMPYEEFIPGTDELSILWLTFPDIYATFWEVIWEVMCHFQICAQLTGLRSGGVKQASWSDYLFQNLHSKDARVTRLAASSRKTATARASPSSIYVNKLPEDFFPIDTRFESFHHQAETPISDIALLASFLMIWLKRCAVPSKPAESIMAEMVYPAVLLAHERLISLLSAMVSCLQHGLRELTSEFLDVKEIGPKDDKKLKTPHPRVSLPYSYLMAWFVMHCPSLMTGVSDAELSAPFIQRLRSAKWTYSYILSTRRALLKQDNYHVFCYAPDFDGMEEQCRLFMDVALGGFASLPGGIFQWLITIRPGYLVFRLGNRCIIEPYLSSRFVRQFGYDQLYVGNPNSKLAIIGNLYEGARACYYWTAGYSHVVFLLSPPTPNCYTVLEFCNWYREAARIPEFNIYDSCLKDVKEMYESRKDSKITRFRGIDEYLACEQEASRVDKISTEVKKSRAHTEKAVGKRALTAEETAQHDKKARRKVIVEPSSEQEPKLLQEAIKSAPVTQTQKGVRKPPTRKEVEPHLRLTLQRRQSASGF